MFAIDQDYSPSCFDRLLFHAYKRIGEIVDTVCTIFSEHAPELEHLGSTLHPISAFSHAYFVSDLELVTFNRASCTVLTPEPAEWEMSAIWRLCGTKILSMDFEGALTIYDADTLQAERTCALRFPGAADLTLVKDTVYISLFTEEFQSLYALPLDETTPPVHYRVALDDNILRFCTDNRSGRLVCFGMCGDLFVLSEEGEILSHIPLRAPSHPSLTAFIDETTLVFATHASLHFVNLETEKVVKTVQLPIEEIRALASYGAHLSIATRTNIYKIPTPTLET